MAQGVTQQTACFKWWRWTRVMVYFQKCRTSPKISHLWQHQSSLTRLKSYRISRTRSSTPTCSLTFWSKCSTSTSWNSNWFSRPVPLQARPHNNRLWQKCSPNHNKLLNNLLKCSMIWYTTTTTRPSSSSSNRWISYSKPHTHRLSLEAALRSPSAQSRVQMAMETEITPFWEASWSQKRSLLMCLNLPLTW